MIILQKEAKMIINYIVSLLFTIGYIIFAIRLTNKIDNLVISQMTLVALAILIIIFMFIVTKKEIKTGTLTFLKLSDIGFNIIKPFKFEFIKWTDIEKIEYVEDSLKNKRYIRVVYLIDNNRIKKNIDIFYREEVKEYFAKNYKKNMN